MTGRLETVGDAAHSRYIVQTADQPDASQRVFVPKSGRAAPGATVLCDMLINIGNQMSAELEEAMRRLPHL